VLAAPLTAQYLSLFSVESFGVIPLSILDLLNGMHLIKDGLLSIIVGIVMFFFVVKKKNMKSAWSIKNYRTDNNKTF